ncbi:unnamed protein product [Amoebophrya sp. A120]|nr:unnamed protein product [Amoebophrya sp. A120]|eukprot:GSA120T00020598001.1
MGPPRPRPRVAVLFHGLFHLVLKEAPDPDGLRGLALTPGMLRDVARRVRRFVIEPNQEDFAFDIFASTWSWESTSITSAKIFKDYPTPSSGALPAWMTEETAHNGSTTATAPKMLNGTSAATEGLLRQIFSEAFLQQPPKGADHEQDDEQGNPKVVLSSSKAAAATSSGKNYNSSMINLVDISVAPYPREYLGRKKVHSPLLDRFMLLENYMRPGQIISLARGVAMMERHIMKKKKMDLQDDEPGSVLARPPGFATTTASSSRQDYYDFVLATRFDQVFYRPFRLSHLSKEFFYVSNWCDFDSKWTSSTSGRRKTNSASEGDAVPLQEELPERHTSAQLIEDHEKELPQLEIFPATGPPSRFERAWVGVPDTYLLASWDKMKKFVSNFFSDLFAGKFSSWTANHGTVFSRLALLELKVARYQVFEFDNLVYRHHYFLYHGLRKLQLSHDERSTKQATNDTHGQEDATTTFNGINPFAGDLPGDPDPPHFATSRLQHFFPGGARNATPSAHRGSSTLSALTQRADERTVSSSGREMVTTEHSTALEEEERTPAKHEVKAAEKRRARLHNSLVQASGFFNKLVRGRRLFRDGRGVRRFSPYWPGYVFSKCGRTRTEDAAREPESLISELKNEQVVDDVQPPAARNHKPDGKIIQRLEYVDRLYHSDIAVPESLALSGLQLKEFLSRSMKIEQQEDQDHRIML